MGLQQINSKRNPLTAYLNYQFNVLRIGHIMSLTGGPEVKTGCGKTWTAGSIGELIDRDFYPEKLTHNPKDFLTALDLAENKTDFRYENGIRPGQVFILDEGEISVPSTAWYTLNNKLIFYSLSTFRYMRSMAIIITPSLKWIDGRIRTLLNSWAYTEKRKAPDNTKKCNVYMNFYTIRTDFMGENLFFRKLKMYNNETKRVEKISRFNVRPPSPKISCKIEELSLNFKKNLRKDLLSEAAKWEEKHAIPEEEIAEMTPRERRMIEDKVSMQKLANTIFSDKELFQSLLVDNKISTSLIQTKIENNDIPLSNNASVKLKRVLEDIWKKGAKPMG